MLQDERTLLHLAARAGLADIVSLLLKKGADMQAKDKVGIWSHSIKFSLNHFHGEYVSSSNVSTDCSCFSEWEDPG